MFLVSEAEMYAMELRAAHNLSQLMDAEELIYIMEKIASEFDYDQQVEAYLFLSQLDTVDYLNFMLMSLSARKGLH